MFSHALYPGQGPLHRNPGRGPSDHTYRPQSTTTRATSQATRIIDVLIYSRVVLKAAISAYFSAFSPVTVRNTARPVIPDTYR
jgi:hypothetical protein